MIDLRHGDCRDLVAGLQADSVDSCVTDPPYALTSGKRGRSGLASPGSRTTAGGFMGKKWDTGEVAFDPAFWSEILRVLKPGAHLLSFGGTRTYHRMVCAIEDAGFEIRDQVQWIYGSGFPKSHNLADEWDGWGTALKPAPPSIARPV
ncbi:MAG: site-specific DNA-methyltransferase, partial [Bradyrhizobium sp.]|nr:site-specific DNA-methyltransferase [Bradyrhizobium sp.]